MNSKLRHTIKGVKMDKVVIFLDYANINCASNDECCDINYPELINYLANLKEGRFFQEAFAYVPIDPRQEHVRDAEIQKLWKSGFVVKTKVGTIAGNTYKCDFDVEMTMDIENVAHEVKPDVIVIISGDSDFIPLVLDLRNKGIRVEVASFGNSMSNLLKERCSGFIDLDRLVDYEEDFSALDEILNNSRVDNCVSQDTNTYEEDTNDEQIEDATINVDDEGCLDSEQEGINQ